MSQSEPDNKKASSKVVKAITPGMKAAHTSSISSSGKSAKKIIVNTTSSRISQRIAAERESAAPSSVQPQQLTHRPPPHRREDGADRIKIIILSILVLVAIIAGIIFAANFTKQEPLVATTPPVTGPPAVPGRQMIVPTEQGLIAHWPLDGNLDDRTESQGASTTKSPPEYIPGMHGQAVRLDGTDPIVVEDLSDALKQLQDRFTICAWVRLSQKEKQPIWAAIVTRGEGIIRLSMHGVSRSKFHVGLLGHKLKGAIILSTMDSNHPPGQWHHVCAVRNDDTILLYVNGQMEASMNNVVSQFDHSLNTPLMIGGNPTNERYIIGDIDDVRIYNRALSENEVQMLVTP